MASLSDLPGAGWHPHARLLTLTTPAGPDVLLIDSAHIDEALGPVAGHAGFRIEITALAADADPSLTGLLDQPVRLDLQTAAALRPFHGHVTQIIPLGANGGFARYRLIVEPWLAFLGHHRHSCLFQDKTVVEIVDEVFAGWCERGGFMPAWRWNLADPAVHARRDMCVQYGESDLAFVRRLLVEEGLCCHFEHEAAEGERPGGHTLVISDRRDACRVSVQPLVRSTRAGATFAEDSLGRWCAQDPLDRSASQIVSGVTRMTVPPGAPGGGDTPGGMGWHDARAEADGHLVNYDGESTLSSAAPGGRFVLVGQPGHPLGASGGREFLVTAVHHKAHNNLAERFPELLVALGPDEPGEEAEAPFGRPTDCYRNRLVAQCATLPWRPLAHDVAGRPLYPRPDAARPLTATVVGPGSPTRADRDLHVRVQFSWPQDSPSACRDRHPGGADMVAARVAIGASLRVVTPVTRARWGGQLRPQPGQEVLVAFLHGNPDRPVVIGVFHKEQGDSDAPGKLPGRVFGQTGFASCRLETLDPR